MNMDETDSNREVNEIESHQRDIEVRRTHYERTSPMKFDNMASSSDNMQSEEEKFDDDLEGAQI